MTPEQKRERLRQLRAIRAKNKKADLEAFRTSTPPKYDYGPKGYPKNAG